MKLAKPQYSSPLIIIVAALALAVPGVAVCASLCPTDNTSIELIQHTNCTFNSHSFTSQGLLLSALFKPPLTGMVIANKMLAIPGGHLLLIYKPPRFFS